MGLIATEEALKEALLILCGNGGAGVSNGERDLRVLLQQSQCDAAVRAVVFDGVAEEIVKHLPKQRTIGIHFDSRLKLMFQGQSSLLAEDFGVFNEACEVGAEVIRLGMRRQTTRVGLRE